MVSVKELAKELGVSSKTIYALVEREEIPFLRIGVGRGTLRFDVDEVKQALRRKSKSLAEVPKRPRLKHLF
jgi:excisionase family DNA binding protein